MVEVDLLINRLPADLLVVLTIKRQMPSEHQIDYDSERPAVHTLVIWLLQQDLGSHVAQGAVRFSASLTWSKRP